MNKNHEQLSCKFRPKKQIRFDLSKKNTNQEILSLIQRLYLQTTRRPSGLIISIIQPLLWLTLFGALFQYAPISLLEHSNIRYKDFLNPGIIIFTSFNSSINAGLPIMFDREFGFINRILASPIQNKNSLVYSCIIHTWIITIIQISIIILITLPNKNSNYYINNFKIALTMSVITAVIISISNISICNAFILPGHIEFIALNSLLINLPTLFGSTALAPMSFMPYWLQVVCCVNPLTYAIEITRHNIINKTFTHSTEIISTSWITINMTQGILILLVMNLVNLLIVKRIIKYKYD